MSSCCDFELVSSDVGWYSYMSLSCYRWWLISSKICMFSSLESPSMSPKQFRSEKMQPCFCLWHCGILQDFQGIPSRINWGDAVLASISTFFPQGTWQPSSLKLSDNGGEGGTSISNASRDHIEVAFRGRQCWILRNFQHGHCVNFLSGREHNIFMNCLCIHVILERMGVPKQIRWNLFWKWWLIAILHRNLRDTLSLAHRKTWLSLSLKLKELTTHRANSRKIKPEILASGWGNWRLGLFDIYYILIYISNPLDTLAPWKNQLQGYPIRPGD